MPLFLRNARYLTLSCVLLLSACLVHGRAAYAQSVCTADDIVGLDPGCLPGSGPCSITGTYQVGDGCTLDFGARAVTLTGTLAFGSGSVTLNAGSFVVAPTGFIDGRGIGADTPGGMICIDTTGAVEIQNSGTQAGRIDVSGTCAGGTIAIDAGTGVTVAGQLIADNRNTPISDGGNIQICAGADITTLPGGTMTVSGGKQSFGGGEIDLTADDAISLGDAIDVSGSCGGTLNVCAGGSASLNSINGDATGDGGAGACIDVLAGTTVQMLGDIRADGSTSPSGFGGGCGGQVCLEADYGDVTVGSNVAVTAQGASPDGGGGEIDILSQGAITVQPGSTVSTRGQGTQGCGGIICATSNLDFTSAGAIDASGGFGGGEIDVCAGTDVTLGAGLQVNGRAAGGYGGVACVQAGNLGPGALLVTGAIDVRGGGCGPNVGCGAGGCASLMACNLTIAANGSLRANAPAAGDGGENDLTAREQLTVNGTVDASAGSSGTDGSNYFDYPQRKPPDISQSVISPPPVLTAHDTCTAAGQAGCLVPCPTCGDGIIEFPETCDNGTGTSCNGCSVFCQTENCDDGLVCTADSCDPRLGCRHIEASTPCMEPTATPTPTVSSTPTATPTNATPMPTATATPSPAPTAVSCVGDCNSDSSVTVNEIIEMVNIALGNAPASTCPAGDANGDGQVTVNEIVQAVNNALGGCPIT